MSPLSVRTSPRTSLSGLAVCIRSTRLRILGTPYSSNLDAPRVSSGPVCWRRKRTALLSTGKANLGAMHFALAMSTLRDCHLIFRSTRRATNNYRLFFYKTVNAMLSESRKAGMHR